MTWFRHQAAEYAEFRPDYPTELFAYAASLVERHQLAWDCGTGNGQAAVGLAGHFASVIATDVSNEQLAHARAHPRIDYRIAPAEASGLADHSVDLVISCQALHWFDRPKFFAEVKRVLVPGGALVVTVYGDAHISDNEPCDAMLQKFNKGDMGEYWPADRCLVDELYASVEFPFPLQPAPPLTLERQWTLPQLAGYLRSWSSVARYIERHGGDPVAAVEEQMQACWGGPQQQRLIRWPFRIFAGRQS